jgi:hypothetical protein
MAKMISGMLALLLMASVARTAVPEYKTTFTWLAGGVPGVLYEPVKPGKKAGIVVFAMHPDGDYLRPGPTNTCMQLAMRGYRALCANAATSKAGFMSDMNQDKLTLNVKAGVEFLRKASGVRTVVLFGHSGGGRDDGGLPEYR